MLPAEVEVGLQLVVAAAVDAAAPEQVARVPVSGPHQDHRHAADDTPVDRCLERGQLQLRNDKKRKTGLWLLIHTDDKHTADDAAVHRSLERGQLQVGNHKRYVQ